MLYEIFRFDGLPIHFFQLRAPQKFKRLLLLGPFLGVHWVASSSLIFFSFNHQFEWTTSHWDILLCCQPEKPIPGGAWGYTSWCSAPWGKTAVLSSCTYHWCFWMHISKTSLHVPSLFKSWFRIQYNSWKPWNKCENLCLQRGWCKVTGYLIKYIWLVPNMCRWQVRDNPNCRPIVPSGTPAAVESMMVESWAHDSKDRPR